MIIERIRECLCGDGLTKKDHLDSISPDVIGKEGNTLRKVVPPEKFKSDIDALETYIGEKLTSGLCINITLQEILSIIPKIRKRVDAYKGLITFMKDDMNIELIIKGRTKKQIKMNKKILFMGKLYDLSAQTLQTIQDEIHYRILDYTKSISL